LGIVYTLVVSIWMGISDGKTEWKCRLNRMTEHFIFSEHFYLGGARGKGDCLGAPDVDDVAVLTVGDF